LFRTGAALRGRSQLARLGTLLAITCVLVSLFFLATNVAALLERNGTWQATPVGLLQRTAIIIGWGWVALVAFRLLLKVKFTTQVMESAEMEISVGLHK
jgi:hypothetical protein